MVDTVDLILQRMSKLDNYLNSKELNMLASIKQTIELGRIAEKDAVKFLDVVPHGAYDSDRRKYMKLINSD